MSRIKVELTINCRERTAKDERVQEIFLIYKDLTIKSHIACYQARLLIDSQSFAQIWNQIAKCSGHLCGVLAAFFDLSDRLLKPLHLVFDCD